MLNPSRWRNIATARTLFVMIFLAGIGLIFSIISLLYLSQQLISTKTNDIDARRSALSVDGAIQTSINRVMSLVIDNAIWDDAVRKVYPPTLDTTWLYNTWGAGYKINNLYDGTFVLDENYRVLWGSFHSKPFDEKNLSFFGEGLQSLISKNRQPLSEGKNMFAGITRTREGIAFIGIGLIRPMTGRLEVYDATRRYLVITRHVNPTLLRNLGNTFQIENLTLADAPQNQYNIPIRTAGEQVVGWLNWQLRQPGAEAANAASPQIREIVLLAAGLILLFIVLSSLGLWKLARGERQAREIALTDWLSHLPNRRALIEQLERISLRGDKDPKTVVFIDLDGFKDVNDIYGHDVGDILIIRIADMLQTLVPPGGMLARMGGDEFAMTVANVRKPWRLILPYGCWITLILQSVLANGRCISAPVLASPAVRYRAVPAPNCSARPISRCTILKSPVKGVLPTMTRSSIAFANTSCRLKMIFAMVSNMTNLRCGTNRLSVRDLRRWLAWRRWYAGHAGRRAN